jgi:hypothetical protein
MAINQAERKRRRWRVLYTVYTATADQWGAEIRADKLASDQQIPIEDVRGIVADLHRAGLVDIDPGLASRDLSMSITPNGRQVVISAQLDAEPPETATDPSVPQMERDARLVLRTLAEYGVTDDDHDRGHHSLDSIDLQGLTNLPAHRLNDAVEFLANSGYVDV